MSPVQELKLLIVQSLHLAKDGIHIYIGFACFMLAVTVGGRSPRSYQALLPGLILSILLEVLDLYDDFEYLGHLNWSASLKDVLNTNLIPAALFVAARYDVFRDHRSEPAHSGSTPVPPEKRGSQQQSVEWSE